MNIIPYIAAIIFSLIMQIVERDFSMYYSKLYSLETEVNRILYEPWVRLAAKTSLQVFQSCHTKTSLLSYREYCKTCVKLPLSKRPKFSFQDPLSLNAGQKYCRMLQVEHSAILLTFIELTIVIKIFVLSFFEWPFYTGYTVARIVKFGL